MLTKVAQELKEPNVPWEVELADTPEHPQVGFEQGKQALGTILVHVSSCIFFLRVIDALVEVALQGSIAAGGVGVEPTACLDSKVCSLLHRLHREVFGRLDDHSALATDPGDHRWPIFVVVPPTWFTLLAAPTRAASQVLFSAVCRLALLPGGVIEVIDKESCFQ